MSSPAAALTHPIVLSDGGDLTRSRLTVFFRILLVIPYLIWLGLWGVLAEVVVIVTWVVALFAGRVPNVLHRFVASYLRCLTQITAYLLLLSDPFPPFLGREGRYPIDVQIAPAARQSRLTVLFRVILILPALLFVYVFRLVNQLVAIFGWFYCLITGHMHGGMQNLSAWLLRYEIQTYGYLLLLTDRYPSLEGGPTLA
jgi:hypothetical protein